MKRSPLQRKTPLKSTSQLARAPLARAGAGRSDVSLAPARQHRIAGQSKKRQRENRVRTELLRDARLNPQICEVPWCTQVGDSPHEPLTRARGGSITDPDNIRMICWPHNQELTLEPEWGYRLGFLKHSWEAA